MKYYSFEKILEFYEDYYSVYAEFEHEAYDWCKKNIGLRMFEPYKKHTTFPTYYIYIENGKWDVSADDTFNPRWIFKNKEDAALFKLTWSGL